MNEGYELQRVNLLLLVANARADSRLVGLGQIDLPWCGLPIGLYWICIRGRGGKVRRETKTLLPKRCEGYGYW